MSFPERFYIIVMLLGPCGISSPHTFNHGLELCVEKSFSRKHMIFITAFGLDVHSYKPSPAFFVKEERWRERKTDRNQMWKRKVISGYLH